MVSEVQDTTLLKALRERLEPLFERYAYLDYLVLWRACGESYGPYSTTVKVFYDGLPTETLGLVEAEMQTAERNVSEEYLPGFLLYCDLWKLLKWGEGLASPPTSEVVIHRDPDKCEYREYQKYQ